MVIVIRHDDGRQFVHTGKVTSRVMEKIREACGMRKPPTKSHWTDFAIKYAIDNYRRISAEKIAENLTKKTGKKFTKNMVIGKINRVKVNDPN